MTDTLTWPARPTCHDSDYFAQRFGEVTWRPASVRLHPENDRLQPFRSCSYCDSMHPEDLISALKGGAKLGGSDWKYGWPHKFYISDIPNPHAADRVRSSSMSLGVGKEPTEQERAAYEEWTQRPCPSGTGMRWEGVRYAPAGAAHGKWYNRHLSDLSPECFSELALLLHQHSGILFERDDNGIKYTAPYAGYQR